MKLGLSTGLSLLAFGLGIATVLVASANRERGAYLNERQRWCEIYSRQNEALRAEVDEREWELLHADDSAREGEGVEQ